MKYLLRFTIKFAYYDYYEFDTLKRLNEFLDDLRVNNTIGILFYQMCDITDISIFRMYKHKRSNYFKRKYKEFIHVT